MIARLCVQTCPTDCAGGVYHTRPGQGEGVSSVLFYWHCCLFYYLGLRLQLGGGGTGLGSGLGSTWVAVMVSRWGLGPWEFSKAGGSRCVDALVKSG